MNTKQKVFDARTESGIGFGTAYTIGKDGRLDCSSRESFKRECKRGQEESLTSDEIEAIKNFVISMRIKYSRQSPQYQECNKQYVKMLGIQNLMDVKNLK